MVHKYENGGAGGIRTLGGVTTQHAFQACALNHSATTPSHKQGLYPRNCGAHYSLLAQYNKPYLKPGFSHASELALQVQKQRITEISTSPILTFIAAL